MLGEGPAGLLPRQLDCLPEDILFISHWKTKLLPSRSTKYAPQNSLGFHRLSESQDCVELIAGTTYPLNIVDEVACCSRSRTASFPQARKLPFFRASPYWILLPCQYPTQGLRASVKDPENDHSGMFCRTNNQDTPWRRTLDWNLGGRNHFSEAYFLVFRYARLHLDGHTSVRDLWEGALGKNSSGKKFWVSVALSRNAGVEQVVGGPSSNLDEKTL